MVSATDFLPLTITWFMNFAKVTLPNLGSGSTSRLATTRLLGMILPFYLFRLPEHRPATNAGEAEVQPYLHRFPDCASKLPYLGRLAPYLERPFLRSATPE